MLTDWTDHDDRTPVSFAETPVADEEDVVRLADMAICPDGAIKPAAFQEKILKRPADRAPVNELGQRDGESMLRRQHRSDADFCNDSAAHYGDASMGFIVAEAGKIRAITGPDPATRHLQAFYIYPDPNDDQPHHAVIRFTGEAVMKTQWKLARLKLLDLFEHRAA